MRIDPRSVRRAAARGELRAGRACGLRILAADAANWWRARCERQCQKSREVQKAENRDVYAVPFASIGSPRSEAR